MVKATEVSRLDNTAMQIARSAGENMLQLTMMGICDCVSQEEGQRDLNILFVMRILGVRPPDRVRRSISYYTTMTMTALFGVELVSKILT